MAPNLNLSSNQLALAAIAGIAAAIMLFSAESGILALMLFASLHATPLFLSGLGIGMTGVLISSVVSAVAILILSGPVGALGFVSMSAGPAIWLSHLALMSQRVPADDAAPDEEADIIWYPVGRLVVWATGIACGAVLMVFGLLEMTTGGTIDFLRQEATVLLEMMTAAENELIAGIEPEALVDAITRSFLMALGLGWLLTMLAGAAIGQGTLERLGHNIRPGFEGLKMVLPRSLAGFVGAALLLSFMSDPWGLLGYSLLPVLLVPYFLLGLATIHVISRAWPLRQVLLVVLYGSMFLGIWPVVPVTILGLLEEALSLRLRFGTAKPD